MNISLNNQQKKQVAIAAQGLQDQTETNLPRRAYKTKTGLIPIINKLDRASYTE
jgi:uncharacterized protein YcaQ